VQQGSEAHGLKQALGVLRHRMPLIVLCVVVVAGAAYGFSRQQTKSYTASASLIFNENPLSEQIAGLPGSSANSTTLMAEEASNIERVKGGSVAAQTASILGRGVTEAKVIESLTVGGQGESDVVVVSATTTSPVLAAKIANTYVKLFVKKQQSANLQYYKSALAIVNRQLAELSSRQRTGSGSVELEDRAQKLRFLVDLKEANVQVAAEATAPTSPSSPKTSRNTGLGVVLGLLIGLALAFTLERLDRRVKEPEDLELIYQLPLLGTVPQSAALSRYARQKTRKPAVLPPAEAEAFSLIRARLRFFNVDRDICTIMIASPESGDGKTMIACRLAEAAARLGTQVLLLELDLRRPTFAQQLDIEPGPGVADVLAGGASLEEAIQSIHLPAMPGGESGGRALDVLAAGAVLPPNPAELIESRAMDALLEQAKARYEFVVIDTPPLTVVSDAFSLLTKVDGVVIVGWVRRTRRDAASRLHQVLASSDVPLLGVIANGSKVDGPGAYASPEDGASSFTTSVNSASPSGKLATTGQGLKP